MQQILSEEDALKEVIEGCKLVSNDEETIVFLGWKGGKYLGHSKTYLVLHNTLTKRTWDTTSFSNFRRRPTKGNKFYGNNGSEKRKLTTEQFIRRLKQKFPDKNWDLSKVRYIDYHTKVCIICKEIDPVTGKEHGEFWAEPANLLSKKNTDRCPRCSGKCNYTTEEFIERANIITGGIYSFDRTVYVNNHTKVIVTCPIHGDFLIRPGDLLNNGRRCPKCKDSKGELSVGNYLRDSSISFIEQHRINSDLLMYSLNLRYVYVDFLLDYNGRKIFIEFNGEQHYKFCNIFHDGSLQNYHRQLFRDLSLRQYAQENGIELLEIPYPDLDRIPEILDAFLEEGRDITTKVTRDLLSGPKQLLLPTL